MRKLGKKRVPSILSLFIWLGFLKDLIP